MRRLLMLGALMLAGLACKCECGHASEPSCRSYCDCRDVQMVTDAGFVDQ